MSRKNKQVLQDQVRRTAVYAYPYHHFIVHQVRHHYQPSSLPSLHRIGSRWRIYGQDFWKGAPRKAPMQGAEAEALVAPPQDRKQGVGRVLEGDNFMCKIHHCGRRCGNADRRLVASQTEFSAFLHFILAGR
jgi:hypothetical protein